MIDLPLVAVIAVGNIYRKDDGVGPYLLQQLAPNLPCPAKLLTASGEGAGLIELWQPFSAVLLLDAVQSRDFAAGTIHRLDPQRQSIPSGLFRYSSHAFSVAEAIELARVLRQLPDKMLVYGINGIDFSYGLGLSDIVKNVADQLLATLKKELFTMHEFSLMADLLRKIAVVAKQHNANKVTSVKVLIGALAHISAEHFREHFVAATQNTNVQGAELEIEMMTNIHDRHAQDIILLSVDVEQ